MGCSRSKVKPVTWTLHYNSSENDSDDQSQDDNYDGYEDYPATSSQDDLGQCHVHWDDEESEVDLPDFGDVEIQSNYTDHGRSVSAKGRRQRHNMSKHLETNIEEEEHTSLSVLEEQESIMTELVEPYNGIDCRAPSLSLWYDDNIAGDILTQDVYVPASGITKYTYYCCLQWNSGKNGGGYCGIQDHERGRNYIFSIWDPIGTSEKIRPVFKGPGTTCEPFGGEGNGLKSWNFELDWEADSWYTFVTRRWDHDGHTYYGLWVKHQKECQWEHIVTIDFPVPNIYYDTWTCSFLEDWEGTGKNERRVHFKNGYKRKLDGIWIPFEKAVFGMVKEPSSRKFESNFDSGAFEDTFYLQSGGKTNPSENVNEGLQLYTEMKKTPDILPVSCYLTKVTDDEIEWDILQGSVPQFRYVLKVDGKVYSQEVNSERRWCAFSSPPKEKIELIVEDIYGKTVRTRFKVGDSPGCFPKKSEVAV